MMMAKFNFWKWMPKWIQKEKDEMYKHTQTEEKRREKNQFSQQKHIHNAQESRMEEKNWNLKNKHRRHVI